MMGALHNLLIVGSEMSALLEWCRTVVWRVWGLGVLPALPSGAPRMSRAWTPVCTHKMQGKPKSMLFACEFECTELRQHAVSSNGRPGTVLLCVLRTLYGFVLLPGMLHSGLQV